MLSELSTNGLTFVTGTKTVLGVGLATAGTVAAGLALAGTAPVWGTAVGIASLAYAVADYSGLVDYSLNGLQNGAIGALKQAETISSTFQNGVSQWSSWQPHP